MNTERRIGLLLRRQTSDMQRCSAGFTPRHDKPARRSDDCPVNCADYRACDAHLRKASELNE